MTQQDIVYELNKMVIGYNITWDSIKYDADKAIMKINAHLGAEFPMMSRIMVSPYHRYTIKYNNRDLPIFPERYILTVVIPFIATEVLARDEEFTAIYNKYAMDFENGLFDMFQNEFNRVLPVFRQDPDVGVFFDKDSKYYKPKQLPDISYKVYYHINNDILEYTQAPIDICKYKYGDYTICRAPNVTEFIKDIYVYTFVGWVVERNGTIVYHTGDVIDNIESDLHLYASWDIKCILKVNPSNGVINIDPLYASKVVDLVIPEYIDGVRVTQIPIYFDKDTTMLTKVVLPKTSLEIAPYAFTKSSITEFILPSYDYLLESPKIKINHDAISLPGMETLYIPYSVHVIDSLGIKGAQKIQCEIDTRPDGWKEDWTNVLDIEWSVANG